MALVVAGLPAVARDEASPYTAQDLDRARSILGDMQRIVTKYYFPPARVGKAFEAKCAETNRALENAHSNGEAFGLIADALASLDPQIRFLPPLRQSRVDYSWKWQLVGDAAYVVEVDHIGDARKQGLKCGDNVLSCEGVMIDRENYQSVAYVFQTLAPRPGLRVLVQSPGKEPRWLGIAATIRPQRKLNSSSSASSFWTAWELSETDRRHRDEFFDLKQHLHRVGPVAIWRPIELRYEPAAVASGLKEIKSASALVLDLRGLDLTGYKPAFRLLEGVFAENFSAGVVKRGNLALTDVGIRGGEGASAFTGTVLVLVDADTGGYAEVLAHVIQQKRRGVIIGDYTMGRVRQETLFGQGQGAAFSFTAAGVLIPTGEIVLADGATLQGKGIGPDLLLRPTPADLAGDRDIVLAKALGMLKQKISPEDAWKLIRLPSEDDDDNE